MRFFGKKREVKPLAVSPTTVAKSWEPHSGEDMELIETVVARALAIPQESWQKAKGSGYEASTNGVCISVNSTGHTLEYSESNSYHIKVDGVHIGTCTISHGRNYSSSYEGYGGIKALYDRARSIETAREQQRRDEMEINKKRELEDIKRKFSNQSKRDNW